MRFVTLDEAIDMQGFAFNGTSSVRCCGEIFTADQHDMAMDMAIQKYGEAACEELELNYETCCGYVINERTRQ